MLNCWKGFKNKLCRNLIMRGKEKLLCSFFMRKFKKRDRRRERKNKSENNLRNKLVIDRVCLSIIKIRNIKKEAGLIH